MSYLTNSKRRTPEPLGLSWSDVTSAAKWAAEQIPKLPEYAQMAPDVLAAAKGIAQDPYLGETACQLRRLKNAHAGIPVGPACVSTRVASAADLKKGIGLRYAVTPLKVAVVARQHPWTVPLALAVVIGIPFALGMRMKGR